MCLQYFGIGNVTKRFASVTAGHAPPPVPWSVRTCTPAASQASLCWRARTSKLTLDQKQQVEAID